MADLEIDGIAQVQHLAFCRVKAEGKGRLSGNQAASCSNADVGGRDGKGFGSLQTRDSEFSPEGSL